MTQTIDGNRFNLVWNANVLCKAVKETLLHPLHFPANETITVRTLEQAQEMLECLLTFLASAGCEKPKKMRRMEKFQQQNYTR